MSGMTPVKHLILFDDKTSCGATLILVQQNRPTRS
jgi:hypothetical protein